MKKSVEKSKSVVKDTNTIAVWDMEKKHCTHHNTCLLFPYA